MWAADSLPGLQRTTTRLRQWVLPEGMIDEIHLQADAERLIAAAFGCEGGEGDD